MPASPPPGPRTPVPRLSVPLAQALAESPGLGGLLARVRESERRLAAARAALPGTLAAQLNAGPLDDTGWTLLVRSGAAAAKLRQCLPAMQARLAEQGWAELPIRIKVQIGRPPEVRG
jgi:hypothetical protein